MVFPLFQLHHHLWNLWFLLLVDFYEIVVSKYALFQALFRREEDSLTALTPFQPSAFIIAAVCPIHLSISFSFIIFIVSFINISTKPSENSVALLFIPQVFALVFITISRIFLPYPVSLTIASHKTSFVETSILPIVFTVAIRFSFKICAFVNIFRGELLSPLSMLQGIFELAFVSISINPNMNSNSVCFSEFPLSYIAVSFGPLPHACSMFQSVEPLSLIKLSIWPLIFPSPLRLAIYVIALIYALTGKYFITLPMFEISLPLALINSRIIIKDDPYPMSLSIDYFPIIQSFFILLEFSIPGLVQGININKSRFHLIILDLINDGFMASFIVCASEI